MKIIKLLILTFLLSGCQKDYSINPSPFKIGDKVKLYGIDPKKSFQPYDCCVCPCVVTNAYAIKDEIYWYYDIKDTRDSALTHVDNKQLKLY